MNISTRVIFKILGVVIGFAALLFLAYKARRVLSWMGTAVFLAIAINPAVEALRKYLPSHKRNRATAIVFLLGVIGLGIFTYTLIPPLADQSQAFAKNLPLYIHQLTTGNNISAHLIRQYNLAAEVQKRQAEIISHVTSASGAIVNIAATLFADLAAGLTILVLTFFLLIEGPRWLETFWSAYPKKHRRHHQELATKMYHAVTGYVAGNLLTSLLATIVTIIMLLILGVPYAITLGLLVGLIDLIPLVGATIAAVVVILVALFTSKFAAIIMLLFYIVYQQVENHALQPLVYAKTVQMTPLLVLAAVLIGADIGGIIGALVAIPIAASLQIIGRDLLTSHQTSSA